MEEEKETKKKFGEFGSSDYFQDILNTKSVKVFESTQLYHEAVEAQRYLQENEENIKGWLNILIIKEFLTIKLEIDLNHLDLTPGNAALLGFNIEEPLIILFSGKETKFLNIDDEVK